MAVRIAEVPGVAAVESVLRRLDDAGERLLQAIGHRFDEIEAELDELTEMRDKPAGTVRITCGDHVLRTTLLPKLPLLQEYSDINVECDVNYGFRDIVSDRFDAGVRLGDTIDKDMIAVPIGPELRMAVAASPAYFAAHRPLNVRVDGQVIFNTSPNIADAAVAGVVHSDRLVAN